MYTERKEALAAELSLKHPAVLAVSGVHNSGKTALLEKLIPLLRARGLKVGVFLFLNTSFYLLAPLISF